jgi:L,D-peptidoglycan transpeptidase YkuD (ErfK/YbiS/YcfS/YnhG family)
VSTLLALLLAATPVPAASRQMVLVVADSWDATAASARLYERGQDGAWRPSGEAMPVSLGRAGLAWGRGLHAPEPGGPLKREGDGRSPAGVFDLRHVTGYSPAPLRGLRLPYRQASASLRCVDDPASAVYNTLVDEALGPKTWTSAEDMRRSDELYRWVVWVAHNDDPPVAGGGSCIFLHLRTRAGAVTAGCTAFDAPALERLLPRLDPEARPVLVQLPRAEWRRLRTAWGLPE